MTVTVKARGAGDLLFESPELQSDEGIVYPATGESVADARMAFLDLVTRGEAVTHLEFAGRASPTAGLWLVFNPHQETTNVMESSGRKPRRLRRGGRPVSRKREQQFPDDRGRRLSLIHI